MSRIVGIDPGIRNLGLASIDPAVLGGQPNLTLHVEVNGPMDALALVVDFLGSPTIPTVLAVEGWGDYGPRKGAFAMLKLIGGICGLGIARGYPVLEFAPREKERVGPKLSRPAGMTDHEWDALCIAHLAMEKICPTTKSSSSPRSRKSLSLTSNVRGSKGTSLRSSRSGRSGSGSRKRIR